MRRAWPVIAWLMFCPLAAQDADSAKVCDISVGFGSSCCGTDFDTYKAVKTILNDNANMATWRRVPWGIEGKFSMCIDVRNDDDIGTLYDRIKAVLPARGDKTRGHTSIHSKFEDE